MTPMTLPIPARRGRLAAAAVLATAILLLTLAASASAAVTSARIDWGFKSDIRTSFPAGGTTGSGDPYRFVNSPAVQNADDTFGFPGNTATSSYASGGAINVLAQYDSSTTAQGTYTQGGFVKLGYWVGGWDNRATAPLEPTPASDATASGIWTRFGALRVQFDEATQTGTLTGIASGGYHGSAPIAPTTSRVAIASLSGGTKSTSGTTVTWSGISATLTNAALGLGVYPVGTALDPIKLTVTP